MPRLSVVVPVYDVADYLADCLDSILAQTLTDLEVVVVDDGSTDGSGALADGFARRDPRVRVVHQANAGLGAARNAGVRLADAAYLAFADSDDVVPRGAYAALVGSLERTGSQVSVGAVERFDGRRSFMTPLMRANHREAALAVTVEDRPLLLADVFAWNKAFRRDFWDAERLAFPERVRYEDQPALTRALVAAESVDVLTETVYRWRVRGDGSSISQRRHEQADLADRLATKRDSTTTVLAGTSPAVQRVWFTRVLPVDMWEYFRAVPGCDAAYWELLRDGVRGLWHPGTVPFERTGVPPRQRLMGWLVAADRRADLETLLAFLDTHAGELPVRTVGDHRRWEHPFAEDPDLPAALRGPG